MPRSFFSLSFALACGLGLTAGRIDGSRWRHVADEELRGLFQSLSSFAQIVFTFLLVSTDNWPSHAVRNAVASSTAGNEEFLDHSSDTESLRA